MNGRRWEAVTVPEWSEKLVDRTGFRRLATTDPYTSMIYITRSLKGALLETVLIHELGHALAVSYGMLSAIHSVVRPERWIDAEEWLCNYVATYGREIFDIASNLLGYEVRRL